MYYIFESRLAGACNKLQNGVTYFGEILHADKCRAVVPV